MLLVVLALLMRVLVPAGFMPSAGNGELTLVLCSGYGAQTIQIGLPGASGAGDQNRSDREHQGKEAPCSFSSAAAPALSGADPVLLAVAMAFILLAAVRVQILQPAAPALRLRPPLRGPPPPR